MTLALRGPIERGDGEIAVEEGRPIVRLNESTLFAGDAITPDARTLLHQIGHAVGAVQPARIQLGERGGSRPPEELIVRLNRVADALAEDGLSAERVEVAMPAGGTSPQPADATTPVAAQPAQVEISIVTASAD